MRERLLQIIGILRLARISTVFGAVANAWFVILWTRWHPEETGLPAGDGRAEWTLLLGGAVSAIGLYAFGACLNDILDASRDRAWKRDRPLARGQIGPESAAFGVAVTLILAVLGAVAFGTTAVVLTGAIAVAILLFNATAKYIPGLGLIILALVYGAQMLVPNLGLRFVWPVWLVMTHAMLITALSHIIARKPPPMTPRAAAFALLGWLVASAVLLWVGSRRAGEEPAIWPAWIDPTVAVWPGLVALAYAVLAVRRLRKLGPGPRAAEKITRYGALWLALYPVAWFVGFAAWREAIVMGALAAVGFVGMVLLRELYGLVEHPVGYRR